ncbi:putative enzyme related to lactoylglutathione lyase [Actinomadura coerulea]|uniref:Putative enzyme related to lactoylglutathione lyase n=1 Tax=Actinomadura coerulea TaxID=46159 RepID=A0A7X0KWZ4_9ACTN|nr:VOC family protein [Actinomadura coerulea]MBB6393797.1 putative enzyme related to lactoylglutathione lyase [Actinomadura coerulea]GGP90191.1 hypothetical protein GCM10010187_01890 [Actinomadura coerulea]
MDPARLHHFCLAVPDLDAVVSELRDLGVALLGGPMAVAEIGQRVAFLTDNPGNIINRTRHPAATLTCGVLPLSALA